MNSDKAPYEVVFDTSIRRFVVVLLVSFSIALIGLVLITIMPAWLPAYSSTLTTVGWFCMPFGLVMMLVSIHRMVFRPNLRVTDTAIEWRLGNKLERAVAYSEIACIELVKDEEVAPELLLTPAERLISQGANIQHIGITLTDPEKFGTTYDKTIFERLSRAKKPMIPANFYGTTEEILRAIRDRDTISY